MPVHNSNHPLYQPLLSVSQILYRIWSKLDKVLFFNRVIFYILLKLTAVSKSRSHIIHLKKNDCKVTIKAYFSAFRRSVIIKLTYTDKPQIVW